MTTTQTERPSKLRFSMKEEPANFDFSTIFGKGVSQWPYSETSLKQAIALRSEQEKTKQHYYKLESLNRSLELIKLAVHARVPGHMIPQLFSADSAENNETPKPQTPPQSSTQLYESDQYNANPTAPINFRFGGARPHARRQSVSPAKIGAQAVASLNRRSSHRHNQTMPSRIDPDVPSKESMMSSHHLIQFHHWTPGSPPSGVKRRRSLEFREEDEDQEILATPSPVKQIDVPLATPRGHTRAMSETGRRQPRFPNDILTE